MKIAFYLDNIKNHIDYSNYAVPNPGIGGTQFLIWTLASKLAERNNNIEIFLFVEKDAKFYEKINVIVEPNLFNCIKKAKELEIDYFILRGPFLKKELINIIEEYKQNTILWSHNFENYITLKNINKSKYIKKNICVSNEQLELLRDTELYEKSKAIYNGLDFSPFKNIKREVKRYQICYIGNLYPNSGYEDLLESWKKVEKNFPEANLTIIGGNSLYDENKIKVAYSKKSFKKLRKKEEKILYDKNKKLKNNVKLCGVCGGFEKLNIMAESFVGIANITPAGDTFGLSAVEFQALGVPVISIKKNGVRETINDGKTGILVKNKKKLAKEICNFLNNENKREELSKYSFKFVKGKFDINNIVKEWEKILFKIEENIKEDGRGKNVYKYDGKRIILINSKIKQITLFKKMPPILFYKYIKYMFKRVLEKLNLI